LIDFFENRESQTGHPFFKVTSGEVYLSYGPAGLQAILVLTIVPGATTIIISLPLVMLLGGAGAQ
jgi:hypothetical protein